MRKERVLELLKAFKGESIVVQYFFNEAFNSIQIENYVRYEIEELPFGDYLVIDNSDSIDISSIVDIECTANEDTRLSLIQASETLQEAFAIAKYRFTEQIEEALEDVRRRTETAKESQISILKYAIEEKLHSIGSNIACERVFEHLCLNTLRDSKIAHAVKNDVLIVILGKIEETIKKLEKEIF